MRCRAIGFARLSRKGLLALILCAVLWMGNQARADAIQTFDASGVFQDGATLGGTITIDTTVGSATAADLTVSGQPALNLPSNVPFSPPGETTIDVTSAGSDPPSLPELTLTLPDSSLVNYSDSSIVPGGSFSGTVLYPFSGAADPLVSGSLDGGVSSCASYLMGAVKTTLGPVDKPNPKSQAAQQNKSGKATFGFVVSGCYPSLLF